MNTKLCLLALTLAVATTLMGVCDAASITIKQDTILSDVNSAEMMAFINHIAANQQTSATRLGGNIVVVEEDRHKRPNEVINQLNFKTRHHDHHHDQDRHQNMYDFFGSVVDGDENPVEIGSYKDMGHAEPISSASFDLSDLQSVDEDFLKANFYTASEMADLLGSQAVFESAERDDYHHKTSHDDDERLLQDLFQIDEIDAADTLFKDDENNVNDEIKTAAIGHFDDEQHEKYETGVVEENEIADEDELEAIEPVEDEKEVVLNDSYFYPVEDEPVVVGHYKSQVEAATTTEESTTEAPRVHPSSSTYSALEQSRFEEAYRFLLGKRGAY